jgi:hypothetical protein
MANVSPPSTVVVFADLDNDPAGGSSINATQENVINASIPTGVQEQVWVWTNFTDMLSADSGAVVDLNISSRKA